MINKVLIVFRNLFYFYYDGFRSMTVGKKLWLIIIIKLFVMFAIFRLFFFKDYLREHFDTDKERGEHVIRELTN